MSELIDNSQQRKNVLKHLILQLHEGTAPETVRNKLVQLLGSVPYGDVVQVEQELISEGLPQEEVLKLCDLHSAAMKGAIDLSEAKQTDPGHPVHTFIQENRALQSHTTALRRLFKDIATSEMSESFDQSIYDLRSHFNALADVEKHYRRKENLVFPFLEKYHITGPPAVMWGKHDEVRELLKAVHEAFSANSIASLEDLQSVVELVFEPTAAAVDEMIYKEEHILFPMCLDTFTEADWHQIYQQSPEIGFCLFDPSDEWAPTGIALEHLAESSQGKIVLPSGALAQKELLALLNTLPVDITFVDSEDTVRYFSQGPERIFDRNRAILGRKVQMCHPPSSVHVVQKILDDFKSGSQDRAAFWIELKGRFIHIEYFALRDESKAYLGTLEVTQDLTEKRQLQGERRILSYDATEGK